MYPRELDVTVGTTALLQSALNSYGQEQHAHTFRDPGTATVGNTVSTAIGDHCTATVTSTVEE